MDLKPELLRGLYACGLKAPSAIQKRAILPMIKGKDVVVQAEPGTGRNTAFSILNLQSIDINLKQVQTLVIAPTREMAQQIQRTYVAHGQYMNVECVTAVGGASIRDAAIKLQDGVHVVVGTPGRTLDMIKRGILKTDHIKIFCLNEADEMLSAGFRDDIYDLFSLLPPRIQIVLLSASMPQEQREVITKFLREPVSILVKEKLVVKGTRQFHVAVEGLGSKLDAFLEFCENGLRTQAVIRCRTPSIGDSLAEALTERGLSASAVHDNTSEARRKLALEEYYTGKMPFLVLADFILPGRIQTYYGQPDIVVNYDLPADLTKFALRVGQYGRSARYGRAVIAVTLAAPEEEPALRELERLFAFQFEATSTTELQES